MDARLELWWFTIRRSADDDSPSPWGEGRGEGGRSFKKDCTLILVGKDETAFSNSKSKLHFTMLFRHVSSPDQNPNECSSNGAEDNHYWKTVAVAGRFSLLPTEFLLQFQFVL
jgi:hypothetical protein